MAFLTILTGADAGTQVAIALNSEMIIGRAGSCNVVIHDSTVSRRHARIFGEADSFFIEDLGSAHGTCVDGQRVASRTQLRDGSWINLYGVSLRFDFEEAPPAEVSDELRRTRARAMRNAAPEHDHRLDLMLVIARQLGTSPDLGEILPKVLEILFEMFPYALSGEILLVQAGGELVSQAFKQRSDGAGESRLFAGHPATGEAARRALETRTAVLTAIDGRLERDSTFEGGLQHSALCVPMIGPSGRGCGVYCLESSDLARRFNARDRELMAGIAVIVAQAIEFARLRQEKLESDALQRQVETAQTVQGKMLPRYRPQVPGYAFGDYYQAAGDVGGEYFGYCRLPDGQIALSIADVSGKGLSAALLMTELCSEVRQCLEIDPSIDATMTRLNQHFCGRQTQITMVLCLLDAARNVLTVANAGHSPPLLRTAATGRVAPLEFEKPGLPLGSEPHEVYRPLRLPLERGDLVVLYTNGVSNARSPSGEVYGLQRLMESIRKAPASVQLIDSVVRDVVAFCKAQPQSDDMCVMCVHRNDDYGSDVTLGPGLIEGM